MQTNRMDTAGGSTGQQKGDILIVDDAPANLRLLSGMLGEQGYKTRSVINGQMALMGARALVYCMDLARAGKLPPPEEQDPDTVTYAHKLTKAEAELDWNQPADVLARQVRAFHPWPVAWCEIAGQRLRVWQAEAVEADLRPGQVVSDSRALMVGASSGALKLLEIQKAGGQRMAVEQFLNAHRLTDG